MIYNSIMKNLILYFALALLVCACQAVEEPEEKPNILFIAIDDLRPELGCYGSPIAVTPNLDRIAEDGLLFNRAYCQEAICSPSRASLMTGARPDEIGVVTNSIYFRDLNPDIVTLPQHFIANGYEAVYTGKIYHGRMTDDEKSWSRKPSRDKITLEFPKNYALPENQKIAQENRAAMIEKYGNAARGGLGNGPAYECADVPDQSYLDGWNTDLAIATVRDMVEKGQQPFFLGYGFHHPHLNWTTPNKYRCPWWGSSDGPSCIL